MNNNVLSNVNVKVRATTQAISTSMSKFIKWHEEKHPPNQHKQYCLISIVIIIKSNSPSTMLVHSQQLMFVRLCHLVKFRFKVWSRAHKYSVPSLNFEVQSWPSLPLTFTLKRRRAADKLWAHLAIFNLKSPQIMKLWKNSAMNLPFLTGLDSRSSYFCPFTPTSTLLSTNPSTRLSSFNEIPLTIANWHEKISLPQRPLSSFYEFSRIDLMWIWGLPRALYDKNIYENISYSGNIHWGRCTLNLMSAYSSKKSVTSRFDPWQRPMFGLTVRGCS